VGTIHREVRQLVAAGILNERSVGNIKLFSLNKRNAVYEEIKNLIQKTEGVVKLVKDAVESVEGVRVAFIYGSFAKGDERQESDIDVFLLGDNINEDELVMNLSSLEKKLFREINYTRYTEAEYKKEKRKNSFISEVIKGKKVFIKGGDNDL
jgi:predicted nucleotidyltransferase